MRHRPFQARVSLTIITKPRTHYDTCEALFQRFVTLNRCYSSGFPGNRRLSGFRDPTQPRHHGAAVANQANIPYADCEGEAAMKVAVQDELMESLAELRRALPSMRLGQLIANMATVARGAAPGAIWEMEDAELLRAIRWQLKQLSSPDAANGSPQGTSNPKLKGQKRRRSNG
jgi:hypothetical protein